MFPAHAADLDLTTVSLPAGDFAAARNRVSGATRGVAVFIPGFTGSKEDFFPLQWELSRLGWAVWSYSQRGQPHSPHPDGQDAYQLTDFVDDAAAFLSWVRQTEQADTVHLLGHSFGGVIAHNAALATRMEDISSLTLLCSGPRGWPDRFEELAAGIEISTAPQDTSALTGREAFAARRFQESSKESLFAIAKILSSPRDVITELAQLAPRTLVAHGESDDAWPIEWQREMASRLGAHYAVIPGAGHLPNEDVPALTAALLNWFWS